ncbi:MAG: hypothetical protein CM15mP49_20860 [Actinomycetota bacterium]|nr:MAG: hypothetical protein CM15mP49_20860 [Actinomycetota bacterium]
MEIYLGSFFSDFGIIGGMNLVMQTNVHGGRRAHVSLRYGWFQKVYGDVESPRGRCERLSLSIEDQPLLRRTIGNKNGIKNGAILADEEFLSYEDLSSSIPRVVNINLLTEKLGHPSTNVPNFLFLLRSL